MSAKEILWRCNSGSLMHCIVIYSKSPLQRHHHTEVPASMPVQQNWQRHSSAELPPKQEMTWCEAKSVLSSNSWHHIAHTTINRSDVSLCNGDEELLEQWREHYTNMHWITHLASLAQNSMRLPLRLSSQSMSAAGSILRNVLDSTTLHFPSFPFSSLVPSHSLFSLTLLSRPIPSSPLRSRLLKSIGGLGVRC